MVANLLLRKNPCAAILSIEAPGIAASKLKCQIPTEILPP